ncbi:MAG: ATP-binding cassette domain-containing protein [Actinobacteria bacterium]|nr:MAG: ATP-binding cassette domain-containing protein [Actinomycetota bacterium]
MSRRHVRLAPVGDGLAVSDLRSTNGTKVDGRRISETTTVHPGQVVTIGAVEIELKGRHVAAPEPTTTEPRPTRPPPPEPATVDAAAPGPTPSPVARPALDELASLVSDSAVVRFRPGSAGEQAAPAMASALRRARRRLAGFGAEPWGVLPQVCLVDPFPDPAKPGEVVTEGTVVDAGRGEIWMVVTPEAPPEPPERPLALFFGAALPAADDIGPYLEGYGLHVAGTPDPDPVLRQVELPALSAADGELATGMALSFVRYLIEREGTDVFVRFLSTAQAGRLDAAAQDAYGLGLAALEEAWRRKLAAGPPDVKTGAFLRLAVRYLRPHVRKEGEMFVYALLGLAFTVVFPFAFRRLLDGAIPSGKFSEVLLVLGALGAAFVVSLLANLRRAFLSAKVSSSVVRQIRTEMFQRLQSLSLGWFSRHQQGDVISRLFNDVALLEQGLSQTLREGAFQALSLLVSAIVLLILNPLLAVIVLLGAPLIAGVYRAMAKGAQRRSIAVQEQLGGVLTIASENYGAQGVVKAFALEAKEMARFGRSSNRLFDSEVRLQLFGGLFSLSVNMIVTFLRLVVLGFGAWLILHHHLTIGGLVAFVSLMGEVLSPVTELTNIGQQLQSATGALVRINEVLDETPEIVDNPDATQLAPMSREVRLNGVGFSYSPERRTLEGIDAAIPAGSRVAFVGPTGAGKSSVLALLTRFYDPTEGSVTIDDRDIRHVTLESLRGQIGVVFQDTFLFDNTVRENIAMGRPSASDAEVEAAARAAELHDFVTTLPRGYATLVGERGGRLSGGQRQRLAIARALLRDPAILLLDEATSALDPRTERLIADTLERVGQGRTTIAVTHRLTSIVDYDRIFVIVDGQLVEQGNHDELVAAGRVYATLWAEQTGGVVTAETPFDAVAALARIPIFAELGPAELGTVAGRLGAVDLAAGETMAEGGGRLAIVRRGHARLLVPDFAGRPTPAAELGPGDAFGVAALLGRESGAVLEATGRLRLVVLDDQAMAGLAATIPAVGAALAGAPAAAGRTAAPLGGRRLSRVTIGPRARPSAVAPAEETVEPPGADEVRRLTGALPAARL